MFRNLFGILFRPNRTLERLLEQRKFGQSWGATWFLVAINALMMFLIGIFFSREVTDMYTLFPELLILMDLDPEGVEYLSLGIMVMIAVSALIFTPLYFVLSRFFFAWIVQLGVRISASQQYPRDPEERREKAKLLRLIQPYTLWIYVLAVVIWSLFLPFVMDFSMLFESALMAEAAEEVPSEFYSWFFGVMLLGMVASLIQLVLLVYMLVVRVIAIKKIYNISGSQAFWGPFLVYFLLNIGLFILSIVFMLINTILMGESSIVLY